MKPALWIFLVISFAGMAQLTYGEESVSAFSNDDSTDDKPIAEMGTEMPDDDDDDDDHDLDDEAEEDEQKETSLFNELYKRGKKTVGKGEPGNKGKKGSKGKKEKSLWYDEVGCYNDAGPKAWQNTSLRALGKLYLNLRGNMNWTQEYAYYVAEKCARAAQPYGCKCFGIQFYGECWCFEGGCKTFAKYGKSNNCREPLGKNWTNYVFTSKCGSKYGCCKDNSMPATGENYEGCPDCNTAVDLVIVVDASGSIGKNNYKTMKEIVIKLIRHFSVRRSYARIGIVRYSSIADEIMSPQESQLRGFAALQVKINRMRYTGGGTSTGRALEKAYSMLMKSRRQLKKFRKIRYYDQSCIVISDGLTNASDKKRLERTSKQLKKIAKVIAVGVRGKNYSKAKRKQQEEELKMIATDKNKDFFIKDDFGKLKKAVDPIAKRACPLTYRKKGP